MPATVTDLKPAQTDEQKLAILGRAPPGVLVAEYLRRRDQRNALQDEIEIIQHKLDLLEAALLAKMRELGQEGFTASRTSVYEYILTTAQVTDPLDVTSFVLGDPPARLGLLELRGSKAGIESFMLDHHLFEPPKGFALVRHIKLGVRKIGGSPKK